MQKARIFIGTFIHSISKTEPFVVVPEAAIGIAATGEILFIEQSSSNLIDLQQKYGLEDVEYTRLDRGQFLIPGFIDTHIHAPQYVNAGLGYDLPLLQWLEKYTFPTESKFANLDFAINCYNKVVKRTLFSGTTTASYFATIHRESSEELAKICHQQGQRALVGKVSMDMFSPEFYIEPSTKVAIQEAETFVKNVLDQQYPRVRPVVTPRFALTCSEELMRGLADVAKKYDVHIQTHLSESLPEIDRALELFPKHSNYTEVYNSVGLCGKKSIMAHCVHMKPDEVQTLKDTQTSIAHCPNSNLSINSGFSPIQNFIAQGVTVGLGTDVSGGYSPSILDAMRYAIQTSKAIQISQNPKYKSVTFRDVLYLATLGGAEALAMDNTIGNFIVGKKFDALLVDMIESSKAVDIFEGQDIEEMFQKFVYLGDDRNIRRIFVDNIEVKSSSA